MRPVFGLFLKDTWGHVHNRSNDDTSYGEQGDRG
jgi:hypothetical protein